MESATQAFELQHHVTAVCTFIGPFVGGQTGDSITWNVCEVGKDDTLECKPPTDDACKTAGKYEVGPCFY